jgi:hypothetical protein
MRWFAGIPLEGSARLRRLRAKVLGPLTTDPMVTLEELKRNKRQVGFSDQTLAFCHFGGLQHM